MTLAVRMAALALAGLLVVLVLEPMVVASAAPPDQPGDRSGVSTTSAALPTGQVRAHDPTMVRQGDWWYLVHTGPGLPLLRSTDLEHWEPLGSVFPAGRPAWTKVAVPDLDPAGIDEWAPALSFEHGRWRLYWAVAVFGTRRATIGLASSATLDPTDPAYGWVDHGPVLVSDDTSATAAIDPDVVTDESGRRWLAWGSFWDGIFVQQLDETSGQLLAGTTPVNLARRNPWWLGIEGVSIVHHGGWWWLFASFGFCCRGTDSFYSVHVARSAELTGPYVDAAKVPALDSGGTTVTGSYGDVVGPGHGSVVADGDRWLLVHHFYDRRAGGAPTLSVRSLRWGPDGWPLALDPGFSPSPAGPDAVVGTWTLTGYQEERPARQPDDATIVLHADGTVSPSGHWSVAGDVVSVEGATVPGPEGPEARRWWFWVDPARGTAIGRDQRTAVARATIVPGPTTGTGRASSDTITPGAPLAGAAPGSGPRASASVRATPVAASPAFTG